MRIFLISDNIDTATGLRLVGVEGVVAHTRAEVAEALESSVKQRDIGIIVMVEKLARQFPDLIDDFRAARSQPLIAEIPDRHGTGRRKDFLSRYIRESIGIKLG